MGYSFDRQLEEGLPVTRERPADWGDERGRNLTIRASNVRTGRGRG